MSAIAEGQVGEFTVRDLIELLQQMPNQVAPVKVEVLTGSGRSKLVFNHMSVSRAGHVALRVVKPDGIKV